MLVPARMGKNNGDHLEASMTMMSYWLLLLLVQVIVRASFCEFRTHKLLIRKELRVPCFNQCYHRPLRPLAILGRLRGRAKADLLCVTTPLWRNTLDPSLALTSHLSFCKGPFFCKRRDVCIGTYVSALCGEVPPVTLKHAKCEKPWEPQGKNIEERQLSAD